MALRSHVMSTGRLFTGWRRLGAEMVMIAEPRVFNFFEMANLSSQHLKSIDLFSLP